MKKGIKYTYKEYLTLVSYRWGWSRGVKSLKIMEKLKNY